MEDQIVRFLLFLNDDRGLPQRAFDPIEEDVARPVLRHDVSDELG